jgi:hypothetical protein
MFLLYIITYQMAAVAASAASPMEIGDEKKESVLPKQIVTGTAASAGVLLWRRFMIPKDTAVSANEFVSDLLSDSLRVFDIAVSQRDFVEIESRVGILTRKDTDQRAEFPVIGMQFIDPAKNRDYNFLSNVPPKMFSRIEKELDTICVSGELCYNTLTEKWMPVTCEEFDVTVNEYEHGIRSVIEQIKDKGSPKRTVLSTRQYFQRKTNIQTVNAPANSYGSSSCDARLSINHEQTLESKKKVAIPSLGDPLSPTLSPVSWISLLPKQIEDFRFRRVKRVKRYEFGCWHIYANRVVNKTPKTSTAVSAADALAVVTAASQGSRQFHEVTSLEIECELHYAPEQWPLVHKLNRQIVQQWLHITRALALSCWTQTQSGESGQM